MSEMPPLRTMKSIQFNDCVNELFELFRRQGSVTRQTFRTTCRDYGVNMSHMQAYYEGVGLRVVPMNRGRKSPCDRFEWRPS